MVPASPAKATVALLESCHSLDDGSNCYTIEDLEKARKGDHVRLVFAKPISVRVVNEEVEVSEHDILRGAALGLAV